MCYDFIALVYIIFYDLKEEILGLCGIPVTFVQFIFAYTVYTFLFGFKYN